LVDADVRPEPAPQAEDDAQNLAYADAIKRHHERSLSTCKRWQAFARSAAAELDKAAAWLRDEVMPVVCAGLLQPHAVQTEATRLQQQTQRVDDEAAAVVAALRQTNPSVGQLAEWRDRMTLQLESTAASIGRAERRRATAATTFSAAVAKLDLKGADEVLRTNRVKIAEQRKQADALRARLERVYEE
ncbi:hypothetical protein NKR19_g9525, partial [Coniochaeta hoffmannii]